MSICETEEASYGHRVYNEAQQNFCSVHEKGFDAVLFVAIGVTLTTLAPRKHYAIVMLVLGALVQLLNIEVNLRELSNAFNLWIGISPAKTFFYIFLPPLLLDSAVRIDFFVFKKVMYQVFVLAFGVVACNCVLLAVFMLYVLNLKEEGWGWTDAFLFACMIASTDALAVTAIMKDGSGPESLIILAEGESLFNDATSIVFFDLFWPRFKETVEGTIKSEPILKVVGDMALNVLWLASGGALIGIAGGYVTRVLFKYLQNRQGHTPVSEVGLTLGMSYLCYYIAESVVKVSGVIAVVVYGLYGAATTQWDISPQARESKVFSSFWDVTQLLTNGIVFFYAGASATNFFYRCEEHLFQGSNEDAWTTILAWLPGVYVGIFLLRFLEIAIVSPLVGLFGFKLKLNEMVFISLAGLRGALALILAQELLQYEFPHDDFNDFKAERKVRAQSALWVCGFVLLTLLINAPGIPFLLRICGLEHLSPIQMKYRKKSEQALKEFTAVTLEEMQTDTMMVVRGVNWKAVEDFTYGHKETETVRPQREAVEDGQIVGETDDRWHLLKSISGAPSIPMSTGATQTAQDIRTQYKMARVSEAPFGGSYQEEQSVLGQQEASRPVQSVGSFDAEAGVGMQTARTNSVLVVIPDVSGIPSVMEQTTELPESFRIYMESAQYPVKEATEKFFVSTQSYFNLVRRKDDLPSLWKDDDTSSPRGITSGVVSVKFRHSLSANPDRIVDSSLQLRLLDAEFSGGDDDEVVRHNMMLTEARFRMLMGLKKYFQQRRTSGFLSAQGLRLLQWACDLNMEKPDEPLHIWDQIADDVKSRCLIRLAFKVRHLLRKMAVGLRAWPTIIERTVTPILNGISRGLSTLLVGELQITLEAAIEYWIALNVYRTHSSWLVDAETGQSMASEIRDQAHMVWAFILDREIESPDRFEAIQTFRAKRAILHAQVEFVDDLFDCGLLEESEHEHLQHDLDHKRTHLSRQGPILTSFEILEFLQNVPFFSNVSADVFRELIATCQLLQYAQGNLISETTKTMESFSFHVVVNGLLRSSYTNSLGKSHEYHLGRGGIFGLLSALSGEHYPFMGNGYAELNAVGHGPIVLTVPHSTLMKIHAQALDGHLQYQQLELDLFRLAALYIIEYMREELLSILTCIHLGEKGGVLENEGSSERSVYIHTLDGTPYATPEADAERMKGSYSNSLDTLNRIKSGILNGEMVLLPANAKFQQRSSFVLVVGSLTLKQSTPVPLMAPVLVPWMIPDETQAVEYKTGQDGAIVVMCPTPEGKTERSTSGSASNNGLHIGVRLAPMPPQAARMHNALF